MDYWTECISESFEDAGIAATKEQVDIVSSWVEGAHENYGMAHGYDAIPNPMCNEVERLEKRIKELEARHERQLRGIREGVARRRNVQVTNVEISDCGHVTYMP